VTSRRIAGCMGALAAAMAGVCAQAQPVPEEAVKAAFVTKFPVFVEWPPPRPRQVICAVGEDAVVLSLARTPMGGASFRRLDAIGRETDCTVLYAAGSAKQTVGQALRAVDGLPVLTITDSRRSAARGMIHFTVQQQRVRFQIDAGRAQRSGLAPSSKLLALAAG
jgi:hypothetical protein